MRLRVGVILGLVLAAVSARADAQPAPTVDRGIALFNDLEYEQAIEVLEAALGDPPDDKAEATEGFKALALSYFALGRENEAVQAFARLLKIDPSYELPRTASEQAMQLFEKARELLPDPGDPEPLWITHEIDPLEPKPGTAVTLTIKVTDPSERHRRVVVFHRRRGAKQFSSVWAIPEPAEAEYRVTISGSMVAAPGLEYYISAVDETGASVGQLGKADSPLALDTATAKATGGGTPIYGKWWFWAGVGGAVVAGILIASAAGGGDDTASVTITANPPAQ